MNYDQFRYYIDDMKKSGVYIDTINLSKNDFRELFDEVNKFTCAAFGDFRFEAVNICQDWCASAKANGIYHTIPDKYLKCMASEFKPVVEKHNCTCHSYDLLNFGCKCGGK